MKKKFDFTRKISFKLFAITATAFTTLLVCALLTQSFFYRRDNTVFKRRQIAKTFANLTNDLRETDITAASAAGLFQKYKERFGIDSFIFLSDCQTEKYTLDELEGYRYGIILEEGISHFKADIEISEPHHYYEGSYTSSDGVLYSTICANGLDNGEILFIIGENEKHGEPGLFDQYFVYICIVGVIASIALSYVYSLMVSKPLIGINAVAKDMAALDFNKKIVPKSNDELGQLGQSLNTLSEKLDSTLNDLTVANEKLEADIQHERNLEKTRKEFVTNISHELKTPLAIIKGYGEALNDNIRADKKEHYLNKIIQQADDMSKLVEDMLDLSRIETGQYKPQPSSFDLAALTEGILESLQSLIDEKSLNITHSFPEQRAYIYADRLKIGQVISNFVRNAIRHTPTYGLINVTISKDASNGETNNDNRTAARFSIENQGKSIDPEKLSKIWDRFYREEDARSKKTGGTGLGLAISAKILQMHNAEYGATNTETGVLFYFYVDVD